MFDERLPRDAAPLTRAAATGDRTRIRSHNGERLALAMRPNGTAQTMASTEPQTAMDRVTSISWP